LSGYEITAVLMYMFHHINRLRRTRRPTNKGLEMHWPLHRAMQISRFREPIRGSINERVAKEQRCSPMEEKGQGALFLSLIYVDAEGSRHAIWTFVRLSSDPSIASFAHWVCSNQMSRLR
jgi:hypothetical protein